MNNIEKTKEYQKFKFLEGNRQIKINKGHFKKLRQAIIEDNQLNLHPIIVNDKFEIIDGQHRLKCAEDLGLDIFYIQSSFVSDQHLISCNVNQRKFEVENYVDFFAFKDKNPEYIRLQQMMKLSGLQPKAILTLIIGIVSANLLDFLKTGKFKFPTQEDPQKILDFYCDFLAYTTDKRIVPKSMFSNHNFTKALRWLFKTSGFEVSIFFRKLDLRWFDLKPQRTSEDWYQLLISIYNFKNHNKLEEDYGKIN